MSVPWLDDPRDVSAGKVQYQLTTDAAHSTLTQQQSKTERETHNVSQIPCTLAAANALFLFYLLTLIVMTLQHKCFDGALQIGMFYDLMDQCESR